MMARDDKEVEAFSSHEQWRETHRMLSAHYASESLNYTLQG